MYFRSTDSTREDHHFVRELYTMLPKKLVIIFEVSYNIRIEEELD